MWKPSWSRRIPGASWPRSITASISRRPTPAFWALGSIVIGPTPRIGSRSSRKFEPTICPSASATTPQTCRVRDPRAHHRRGGLDRGEVAREAVMVVDVAERLEDDARELVGVGGLGAGGA